MMVDKWKLLAASIFILAVSIIFVFGTSDEDGHDDGDKNNNIATPQVQGSTATSEIANTSWSSHLESVPGQWVSAKESLSITFSHPVTGDAVPQGQPVLGIVTIEPRIPTKVSFSSDRELEIELAEPLERTVEYSLTIFPDKLSGVNNELRPYKTSFKPYRQDFSIAVDGLKTTSKFNVYSLSGTLTTNDADAEKGIEAVLSAKQDGKTLGIEWFHNSATEHAFIISEVSRKSSKSEVELSWQGKAIDVDKSSSLSIPVPAIKSFEVVGVVSEDGRNKFIAVTFSEPLDRNQSMKGLVKVNGKDPGSTRISGNSLRVYPREKLTGDIEIEIYQGITSTTHARLRSKYVTTLTILNEHPGVRFMNRASILPTNTQVIVPIEAVNVDSVQITAYRMKVSNIGQFLQSYDLSLTRPDQSTTAALWKKTFALPEVPKDKWVRFDLELTDHFQSFDKDLLAFEVRINQSNVILDCGSKRPPHNDELKSNQSWPFEINDQKPAWVQKYYKSRGRYSWRDRKNPCKEEFYSRHGGNQVRDFRYFHPSNIGLLAKIGVERSLLVVATSIDSAEPLGGANVVAYNAQHQPVGRGITGADGMLTMTPVAAPLYMIANHDEDIGFLRLTRNTALSTNLFDTGGEKTASGVKGFFYGERGVWRPGDDIFLTFVVHDRTGIFPKNHPLTLEFFDPKGNQVDSISQPNPVNNFYHYKLKTNEDSPTGNWQAIIRYGGQYFGKKIPIETIKPNRLKIDLEFPSDDLSVASGAEISATIFSQWLNGATASNLKADIEMNIRAIKTKASGYDAYIFDDVTRELNAEKQKIFEGKLDGDGRAKFTLDPMVRNAPGKLRLNFATRVFEKSGNFSIQYSSVSYMPYPRLVGMNVPKGSGWNDSISREGTHRLNFILLDDAGNTLPDTKLNFEIYRIGWRWWWDRSDDKLSSYINSSHANRTVQADLKTDQGGKASWDLVGKDYDWGRYLLRVCEATSGHCSSQVVYLGWSYDQKENPSGDTQLMLTTDKKRYKVGDSAVLTIPQALPQDEDKAKILLTIESGTKILSQKWIENDLSDNRYEIEITEQMAPNVYAHVTLIQGHKNKANDSPIRLYGITPILVDNEANILEPQLSTPEKVAPKSKLAIGVSEKSGKPITYTLAVVDEGLLGITNYKTPDPRKSLYKREALGVLTWDMYDLLSRSSIFQTERLLSIGGSDNEADASGKRKKRRFPPVVRFVGPFTLKANDKAEHEIQLPDYMGAVRVMLVAGNQASTHAAYGTAQSTIKVTQPLTVFATLPRVLGPNESFQLPVNVFANDDSIKEVAISVRASEIFETNQASASLQFTKTGDKIISLDMKTRNSIGEGEVIVVASSGQEKAEQRINIQVRTANLPQTVSDKAVVKPGESIILGITPNGMPNTNTTYLEMSRVPQIDLESRMDYLIGYPHGCLEQVTSRLFPQIFLGRLLSLTDEEKKDIEFNVNEGFRRYANFQSSSGSFNYWPGGGYSNQWANSYAGHLLIEARNVGYAVPASLFDRWLQNQKSQGKKTGERGGYESTDAYTLFTLARADAADLNAMNRLREKLATLPGKRGSNYRVARWLLAAAYAQVGIKDAATELLNMGENIALDYDWSGYTYGSRVRDAALLAITYGRVGQEEKAWEAALDVSNQISKDRWHSTQSLAWGLMALSDFFNEDNADTPHPVDWKINQGALEKSEITAPIYKQVLENTDDGPTSVEIFNKGNKALYALLGNKGIPENTAEVPSSSGVNLEVSFSNPEGESVDVASIEQGEDFVAKVRVYATSKESRLENLALTMTAPSGWEISNDRMKGLALAKEIEYQDIRDDRVLSYFTLGNYYWWHRNNKREVTLEITLNASYAGRFYLPGWRVESMYDRKIAANTKGQWVEVVPK